MMKMVKYLLAFVCVSLCLNLRFTSAKSTEIRYCNTKANYPVKVSGVDIDPYPVSRGKNTSFSITASTEEPISSGKLVIDVTYFIFHVYSENKDLCTKTSCPISGDFTISHSQELPGYTPPGTYELKMSIVDGHNKQLTCITFDFSIGFVAPEGSASSF